MKLSCPSPSVKEKNEKTFIRPVGMVRAFAERLRRAGVPVTLVEEEGMEHVWTGPKRERALEQTLHFLDRHLRP